MSTLSLAISPCPNDTLIFEAIINKKIPVDDFDFDATFLDIEKLNNGLLSSKWDVAKVSVAAFPLIKNDYTILKTGMAIGFGNGPLLVSNKPIDSLHDFNGKTLIPGIHTTANLLLESLLPNITNKEEVIFNEIMPLIQNKKADAGLIIHESRFTFQNYGLKKIADLGELWHEKTSLPLPLGAFVAKRSLGFEKISKLETLISGSIKHGLNNINTAMPFISSHAQELDEKVIFKHIQLYVNDFSVTPQQIAQNSVLKLLHSMPKNHSLSLQDIFQYE